MNRAQSGYDVIFGGADRTFGCVAPMNAARCELKRDHFVGQNSFKALEHSLSSIMNFGRSPACVSRRCNR